MISSLRLQREDGCTLKKGEYCRGRYRCGSYKISLTVYTELHYGSAISDLAAAYLTSLATYWWFMILLWPVTCTVCFYRSILLYTLRYSRFFLFSSNSILYLQWALLSHNDILDFFICIRDHIRYSNPLDQSILLVVLTKRSNEPVCKVFVYVLVERL